MSVLLPLGLRKSRRESGREQVHDACLANKFWVEGRELDLITLEICMEVSSEGGKRVQGISKGVIIKLIIDPNAIVKNVRIKL